MARRRQRHHPLETETPLVFAGKTLPVGEYSMFVAITEQALTLIQPPAACSPVACSPPPRRLQPRSPAAGSPQPVYGLIK